MHLDLDRGVVLTVAGLLTRLGNLDRASGSADTGADAIAAELLRLLEADRLATLHAFERAHRS